VWRRLEIGVEAVFGDEARLEHVELQRADHADDPAGTDLRPEHLRHALLRKAFERAGEMFLLYRIGEAHAAQDFRREIRDAGEHHFARFRQRVADPQDTVVGNADDVAGPGLVHRLALLREEQDRIVHADRFPRTRLDELHAAPKAARAEPEKRDAVAM